MADRLTGIRLSPADIPLAAVLVRIAVAYLQQRDQTVPAGAVQLRDQLAAFALDHAYAQVSGSSETANPVSSADPAQSGLRLDVNAAAAELGITRQAVRAMCRRGVLIAVKTPHGSWAIDARTLDSLAARRRKDHDDGREIV